MKWLYVVMIIFLVSGCSRYAARQLNPNILLWHQQRDANTMLADRFEKEMVQNAIIEQHTVYEHHFVVNKAVLNELGKKNLDVLAEHFKEYPSQLILRCGNSDAQLKEDRKNAVTQFLSKSGVDTTQVALVEGIVGGKGMRSTDVEKVLSAAKEKCDSSGTVSSGIKSITGE